MYEVLMFFDPIAGDLTPNLAETVRMMSSAKDM